MAAVLSIPISGHVETAIYRRANQAFISLDGKELPVLYYCPGTSKTPLLLVQPNERYYSVQEVPVSGKYCGDDILERISHDISVFWTKLSSLICQAQYTPEFDVTQYWELSDIMVQLAHQCGIEIEKERSQTRTSLLDAESSNYANNTLNQQLAAGTHKVEELMKTSYTLSQALKRSKPSKGSPLLHRLCQDNSVSVAKIVMELGLNIRQKAPIPSVEKKLRIRAGDVEFEPIHAAALCGNASAMKELYQLDPSVAYANCGGKKWSVLELCSFGSLECFELCQSWLGTSKFCFKAEGLFENDFQSSILKLAALGGNSKLLESLIPSPQSFSVSAESKRQYPWLNLVENACFGGHLGTLDWLMKFGDSKAVLNGNVFFSRLMTCPEFFCRLDCVKKLVDHGSLHQRLFEPHMEGIQRVLAFEGRIEILEWTSKLNGFKLECEESLLLSACTSQKSVAVMEWVLKSGALSYDQLNAQGEHLVLKAARNGQLDCLKWICNKIPAFQNFLGSRHLLAIKDPRQQNISHIAATAGSVPILEWLYTVHGVRFSEKDKDGRLPIHEAFRSVKALKWMVKVGKCDLEARDSAGLQVLHHAIQGDHVDVVTFILSHVKDARRYLNTHIGQCHRTAAHFVWSSRMAKIILQFGAILFLPDRDGQTLYDYARRSQYQERLVHWLVFNGQVVVWEKSFFGKAQDMFRKIFKGE